MQVTGRLLSGLTGRGCCFIGECAELKAIAAANADGPQFAANPALYRRFSCGCCVPATLGRLLAGLSRWGVCMYIGLIVCGHKYVARVVMYVQVCWPCYDVSAVRWPCSLVLMYAEVLHIEVWPTRRRCHAYVYVCQPCHACVQKRQPSPTCMKTRCTSLRCVYMTSTWVCVFMSPKGCVCACERA